MAKQNLRRRGLKPIQIEIHNEKKPAQALRTQRFEAHCITVKGNKRTVTMDAPNPAAAKKQLSRSGYAQNQSH